MTNSGVVALAVMDEQIIELKDLRESHEASIEGKSKQQVGIHSPGTLLFHQIGAGDTDRAACGFAFHIGQVKISSKNNGDESCRQRSRYYCCCC